MTSRENAKPGQEGSAGNLSHSSHLLILYNDDVHSFDYVIKALVDVCDHSPEQAEQCTYLAHYKGQCMVRQGERKELELLQRKFKKLELKTTIETEN